MKIEEKEICQELNVTEKACSMAMYLFLRTIFSKEEFSDTVTEEFRWIVEEFSKAQTEPALLKTLWNELISGPYMNDDDPKLSMRCVKDELSELGYDWAITTPICQVLYKMHENDQCFHENDGFSDRPYRTVFLCPEIRRARLLGYSDVGLFRWHVAV